MNHLSPNSIDRVLNALGNLEAPSGLEQRIAARLAQRAHTPALRNSFFSTLRRFTCAPTNLYATAAAITFVLLLTLVATHRSPTHPITVQSTPISTPASITHTAQSLNVAQGFTVARAFSLGSHRSDTNEGLATPTDYDAIALAETLAPSHPAPPEPLTAQEALLIRATRPGQPIEVAELDAAREPALRAIAAAHERTSLREYIHGLLGPLAAAESLTPSSPPDEPTRTSSSEQPSSR